MRGRPCSTFGKGILTPVRSPPGDPPAHRPTGPSGRLSVGTAYGSMLALRPCSHCALGWAFPLGMEVLGGITCQPRAQCPAQRELPDALTCAASPAQLLGVSHSSRSDALRRPPPTRLQESQHASPLAPEPPGSEHGWNCFPSSHSGPAYFPGHL